MTFVPVVVGRSIKNAALLRKLTHRNIGYCHSSDIETVAIKTISLSEA